MTKSVASNVLNRLGFLAAAVAFVAAPAQAAAGSTDCPKFKAMFASWKAMDGGAKAAVSVPSAKPVKTAALTSNYGPRTHPVLGGTRMHSGLDLAGPVGTPIYATADGYVGRANYQGAYGNLVELEHGAGVQTRYAHLSSMLVRPGQRVTRGQLIARMGSTGRSTGSHLHYEVRLDGQAVNPELFVRTEGYVMAAKSRADLAERLAMGGPEE